MRRHSLDTIGGSLRFAAFQQELSEDFGILSGKLDPGEF